MTAFFQKLSADNTIRREIWETRWNPGFKRILIVGCVSIEEIFWMVQEFSSSFFIWLMPIGPKKRINIPEELKERIKLIVNVPVKKFRGGQKFDLLYWNGSHVWDEMIQEFEYLRCFTHRNTQWVANHVAPHRNWGKYPYGYLRHGVEGEWIQWDAFYEESTTREVYDDAWVWFHYVRNPPTPGTTKAPSSHKEPKERKKTVGEMWEKQERLVWITNWTARVESATTKEELETLHAELMAIRAAAPTHSEDGWSRRVWREKCEKLKFELSD
jgi:hypothetical protein